MSPDPAGVRDELRALVAARGVALFEGWRGPAETKADLLAVLYAGRNLLLEGPVGSGKTMLARSIAAALPPIRLAGCSFGCLPSERVCPQCRAGRTVEQDRELAGTDRFVRIQGAPDLFPEDLVGDIDPVAAFEYGPSDPRALRPGALLRSHRRLCFIDELNRLPERVQNLLLEVLEERAMTIAGSELRAPVDTVVIATMNPEEHVGVERLSEALRDRFERVRVDYPSADEEVEIVLAQVSSSGGLPAPRAAEAIVRFARELRASPDVEIAPSVRATVAAYELAAARHGLAGGDWRTAVRRGLRLALRGRVMLNPGHARAADPDGYLAAALGRLAL